MALYKIVNGQRVQMSDEEEAATLAEWKKANDEREAQAQELYIRNMVAGNKLKGRAILDKYMLYLAMQEASTDKLKDITSKHMNIYALLDNGALVSALSAIDDVDLNVTLVSSTDFDYLKQLINEELV